MIEEFVIEGINFYKSKNEKRGEFRQVMYFNPNDLDTCIRLIHEKSITSLHLSSRFINKENKINFGLFSNKILSLTIDLEFNNLEFIDKFINLNELYIKCPKKPSFSLESLKNLKILSFLWSNKVMGLDKLENLEFVRIWNYGEETLISLRSNKLLKKIDLIKPKITSFSGIEDLKELEYIDVEKGKDLKFVESFTSKHTSMKTLRIFGSPELAICNSVGYLKNLEVITFGKVKNLDSFTFLKNLEKLTICGIHPVNVKVSDNDYSLLNEVRAKVN